MTKYNILAVDKYGDSLWLNNKLSGGTFPLTPCQDRATKYESSAAAHKVIGKISKLAMYAGIEFFVRVTPETMDNSPASDWE